MPLHVKDINVENDVHGPLFVVLETWDENMKIPIAR
jgi:hypothetical protein